MNVKGYLKFYPFIFYINIFGRMDKMLNLVLGRASSGKTQLLYEKMSEYVGKNDMILLVPEQFSFEAEKQIYRKFGAKSSKNIKVLSFTRLSYEIFKIYGGMKTILSDMQKQILMSVTLNEITDDLKVYNSYKKNTAFVKSMVDTLDDLKSAGADADKMLEISDNCNETELQKKLYDLGKIYETYNATLEKYGADPKDNLKKAIQKATENRYFENKIVFIDSFMAFSPIEHSMLYVIFEQAKEVYAAFCTSGIKDKSIAFEAVNNTIKKLQDNAKAKDLTIEITNVDRNQKLKAISNIEKYFLADEEIREIKENDGIMLYEAKNPYDEILNIAAKIRELVYKNQYKYRDIAVIMRDTSAYEKILPRVFHRFEIPFYMDIRKDISDSPLILGLNAALNCAINMNSDNLIKFAKSPISPISGDMRAENLENYCYTWSIKTSEWAKDFTANPKGITEQEIINPEILESLNEARNAVYEPMINFSKNIKDVNGIGFAREVYELLRSLNAYQKSMEFPKEYSEVKIAEYKTLQKAVWDNLMDILDIFANIIGESKMPLSVYIELLQLCFDNCDLGQIPQTLDHVIVGQADRIRPDDVKAVFVIDCVEGVFPAEITSGGILNENDREKIQELNLNLTADLDERETYENYYAYYAVTRPSEKLYISYPIGQLNGGENKPSVIYTEVKRISDTRETQCDDKYYRVWNTKTAIEALSENYDDKNIKALLEKYIEEIDENNSILEKLAIAKERPTHKIEDEALAEDIFGRNMMLSPSKLDKFYSCKFAYYTENVLKIRKRQKVDVTAIETGKLIHFIMEKMLKHNYENGMSFTTVSAKERETLVRAYLKKYMETNISKENLNSRVKYLFERIGSNLIIIIEHLAEELSQSKFVPVYFEEKIGPDKNCRIKNTPLTCADGSIVSVEGIADRIDAYKAEETDENGEKINKTYYRVIDYKTGIKKFSKDDIAYGLNMQMLIYLFALCPELSYESEKLPGGILYMPAKNTIVSAESTDSEESVLKAKDDTLKMNGLILNNDNVIAGMEEKAFENKKCRYIPVVINKDGKLGKASSAASLDEMQKLKEEIETNIKQMAEILHTGNVEAMPTISSYKSNPCEYCIFNTACGHRIEDKKITVTKDDESEER